MGITVISWEIEAFFMGSMGKIKLLDYLKSTNGLVIGKIVTDGKDRTYKKEYSFDCLPDSRIVVYPKNGSGDRIVFSSEIDLTRSLIAFFGLYSGDGSKGTEDPSNPSIIKPAISFSQREPNLVRFAVEQFRHLFSNEIGISYSLGEDSAFFMAGEGKELLTQYHNGVLPVVPELNELGIKLSDKDKQYLNEKRPVEGKNEDHLAFYYFFKKDMEFILSQQKRDELLKSGLKLGPNDNVTASLRRPFKKGARLPGGSSRSDEIYLRGVNGFGELFLKMMHELESSIYEDSEKSPQGLIQWIDKPASLGTELDVIDFYKNNPYGQLNSDRPSFKKRGIELFGTWPRGKEVKIKEKMTIDPLMCYVSGLYLAEGTTPKANMFAMYTEPCQFAFGFTSTENDSIELVLRSMKKLFYSEDCVQMWKVKVGSQYFPELVVIGLKDGVPMLRGGCSGDGKLRTMEISISIKDWALGLAPCLLEYSDKYSHVEPTGAGIARIDFSSSSALCKWYFTLLMYTVFGETYDKPVW